MTPREPPPPADSHGTDAPTAAMLQRLRWLLARAAALRQELAAIERESAPLSDVVLSAIEETERDAIHLHGYLIRAELGRRHPKWKAAYVRDMGRQAADRVEAAALRSVVLRIEPAAAAPG